MNRAGNRAARGDARFALLRTPLNYRNEYVFSAAPQFSQRWGLCTEKDIKDKTAFLAMLLRKTDADQFRFERGGRVVSAGKMETTSGRHGLSKELPDTVRLSRDGHLLWSWNDLHLPANADCQCFVNGRQFFLTLLDGKAPTMQAGRWYEFATTWSVK